MVYATITPRSFYYEVYHYDNSDVNGNIIIGLRPIQNAFRQNNLDTKAYCKQRLETFDYILI